MTLFEKTILKASLALLGASLALPAHAETAPEDIYDGALPSVMTLEVQNAAGERFIGSAFVALRSDLAVTAWHVVHDAERVEARFADGQRAPVAGLVDKDEANDLALVRLAPGHSHLLPLNVAPPRIGSRIYVVGAPKGFDFSLSEGLISQVRSVDGVRYYQLSMPISPGDSGGPVLSASGAVLGVISWRKANAENLAFAIPSAALARLNPSRATIPWPAGTPTLVAKSPPSQAARAQLAQTAPPGEPVPLTAIEALLAKHAGKTVTVTVRDTDKEESLSLKVPASGSR